MLNLLSGNRYVFRELLPRWVLMTLFLLLVLPHSYGMYFQGNFITALSFGWLFTAYFWLWGSKIMNMQRVRDFLNSVENNVAMFGIYMATLVFIPLPAIYAAVLLRPSAFVITAWYGAFIWIVALNVVCAFTHDYGVAVPVDKTTNTSV